MQSKINLQRLAEIRLEDSILLLRLNKASSAYYLAGYSVELALKVCISNLFQNDVIPDKGFVNAIYTHRLENLMSSSGLLPDLKEKMKKDPEFGANWGIVTKWNESSRYEIWDPISAATLINSINDKDHGIFPWVKKHW